MYKIKSLHLKNFEGMSLANIESFNINHIDDYSIILGRNGSGKSKVMAMFFPLAPSKKQFTEGGYYKNVSEKDGEIYSFVVKSKKGALKCSITNVTKNIKICVDVNPKVYNSHVETITGLTPEIVKVLSGKLRFTQMPDAVRKQWLDRFSSNDLSYALGFLKRTKNKLRDTVGVLKHLNANLSTAMMTANNSKEERESIRLTLEKLEKETNEINVRLYSLEEPKENVNEEILNSYFEELSKYVTVIKKGKYSLTENDRLLRMSELEELYSELGRASENLSNVTEKHSRLLEELQQNEYYLRNRQPLLDKFQKLTDEIEETKKEYRKYAGMETHSAELLNGALADIENSYMRLDSLCDNLSPSAGIRSVRESHEVLVAKLDEARTMAAKIEFNIKETSHILAHYESVDSVSCPKCKHGFKPGLADIDPTTLKSHLTFYYDKQGKVATAIDEYSRQVKESSEQLDALREIQDWLLTHMKSPVLGPVVSAVANDRVIQTSPKQFHLYLKDAIDDINVGLKLLRLNKQKDEVSVQLRLLNDVGGKDMDTIHEKMVILEQEMSTKSEQIKVIEERIATLRGEVAEINKFMDYKEKFLLGVSRADTMLKDFYLTSYHKELNGSRKLMMDQWVALKEKSSKLEREAERVEYYQKEIAEVKEQQDALKAVVESLSPEKGLLKEYYYNTVARVTDLMNEYLSSVWEYPLEIQPCPLINGDLSYSFPYTYGNDRKEVEDVSEGSDAQVQIFDMVFRLMAYKAMGFMGYPLFLDEPGTGFDESHRASLVVFLKSLIEDGTHSQLAMISHQADVHSRLNRADFIVVDPEGISVPTIYNRNVEITYFGESDAC